MVYPSSNENKTFDEQLMKLQQELELKNQEVMGYLDEIEKLEEEIMRLRELIPDAQSKKKGKKTKDSKLQIDIEGKDREIRELKNRMGFLRKEKLDLQKELELLKSQNTPTNVISVEEIRGKENLPLNVLISELQEKLNKQESIIRRLRSEQSGSEDVIDILKEKEEQIESLNLKIAELNQSPEVALTQSREGNNENYTQTLLKDLQSDLTKVKRRNSELQNKLDKFKKKDKSKEKSISTANESGNMNEQMVEELQTKLNKAKTQINLLQNKLTETRSEESSPIETSQGDVEGKLKIQREMASFLQQQLDDVKHTLKTKEEEIATIKNEAIRIKRKYEDLESQAKIKDQEINSIKNELISYKRNQNQITGTQPEDPQLILRVQELKSVIDDLNKQNIQQRLEISQLRKSK